MQTKTNRQRRTSSHVSHSPRTNTQGSSRPSQFSKRRSPSRFGGAGHGSQNQGRRFGSPRGGRGNSGGRKMKTFDPSQFINTNPVELTEEVYTPKNSFDTFGLDKNIVKILPELGLKNPSPIQDQVISHILKGQDVIGLAETGTGKTAAFLLPLITKTLKDKHRQTLILTPTRELAIQIENELRTFTKGMRIFSTVCVGGTGIGPQIKGLRQTNHFVIGTPGRILDLIQRKHFKTEYVTTVVLDEADRMLDMGFIHDMRSILKNTPHDRETLFFSATMDKNTEDLVNDFMKNPITVSVKKKDVTSSIEQDVVRHRRDNKFETLLSLLQKEDFKRIIIFGAMKHKVQKLADDLSASGIRSESIHGNKSHGQRQRALGNFKNGRVKVLVATDVAARGIHVDDVSHVINYELPTSFEDYVHRIGRTGRSNKRGKALTFISEDHR
jgi:ATP-dependent RNA helicase RhlE